METLTLKREQEVGRLSVERAAAKCVACHYRGKTQGYQTNLPLITAALNSQRRRFGTKPVGRCSVSGYRRWWTFDVRCRLLRRSWRWAVCPLPPPPTYRFAIHSFMLVQVCNTCHLPPPPSNPLDPRCGLTVTNCPLTTFKSPVSEGASGMSLA